MDRFSIAVRIVLSGISAIAAASRREKPFLAKLTPHNKDTTLGGVFIVRCNTLLISSFPTLCSITWGRRD